MARETLLGGGELAAAPHFQRRTAGDGAGPFVAYLDLEDYKDETIEAAGDDMLSQAKLLAEQQQVLTGSTAQTLRVVAQLDTVVEGTVQECSAELRRVNATFDHYHNIGVIDPDGYIRCAAQLAKPPVFAGDRDYYQAALATGVASQGSYQIGRITGLPAVNFGLVSRHDNGTLRGVVYAALAVGAIVDAAERASVEEREIIIVSASGETLAASDGFGFQAGDLLDEKALTRIRLESSGKASLHLDGRHMIAGFTSLPGPSGPAAYVIVGEDQGAVQASAQLAFRRSTAVLAAAVILSLGAAVVVSERLIVTEHRRRISARTERIKRLQDNDTERIRLVNTIGHDLASPLTPVKLQLHMLRTRLTDEKEARAVQIIHRNFEQVQRLVGDLRDIFKLQAGRMNLAPVACDLSRLAAEARDSVSPVSSAAGIIVELDAKEEVRLVADKDRVFQVITNLLTNAIKFSASGGRITISVARDGAGARLAVKDAGRGLTADEMDRLFQPFSQVHDRSEVAEKGTGLGLYICRGIIESHGGQIGVQSEGRGNGSEFWFWLPDEVALEEHY